MMTGLTTPTPNPSPQGGGEWQALRVNADRQPSTPDRQMPTAPTTIDPGPLFAY